MGDRGENENEIEQSENELTGETEETNQVTGDNAEEEEEEDQPPPLEDIDDGDNETEDSTTEPVAMETTTTKEDDTGRAISIKRFFYGLFIRYPFYPTTITKRCHTLVI